MNREYGKVAVTFWSRGSGKRLRGDPLAQLVALHLSTCRFANSMGVFYIPLPAIAHEIGSPIEGASEAIARTIEAGFCEYDLASEMVWIPNHAKIEIGPELKGGDKRKPHLQSEFEALGNHPFAQAFWDRYGKAYGLAPSEALASPFEGPWEPLRSQSKAKQSKAKQGIGILESASLEFDSRGQEPTPIAQVRKAFLDGYAVCYPKASPYPWGSKENGQTKTLLQSVPLAELLTLVGWFFKWRRAEVIKAGHSFGTGSCSLVMKHLELRADLAHPERRAFAADAANVEHQENFRAAAEASADRVVAKIMQEQRNGNVGRISAAGSESTTLAQRDRIALGDPQQAPVGRSDGPLGEAPSSVRERTGPMDGT